MAKAMECDVCKKLYKIYNEYKSGAYNAISTDRIYMNNVEATHSYDLCPTCMKSVLDFLKSGGKFGER